jgi:hypothetical protein
LSNRCRPAGRSPSRWSMSTAKTVNDAYGRRRAMPSSSACRPGCRA